MGLKRSLVDMVEAAVGVKILYPEKLPLVFEEVHLKRFFAHFQVDCVFDVGANEGQYADMIRDRTGFHGPIISYEPNPDMLPILQEKAKQHDNWFIESKALSASEGEASFNVMAGSQFSSLLQPQSSEFGQASENKIVRTVPVKTSTLKAEFLKYKAQLGFSRPFLKMDTQGNDMAVVESAGDIIGEFVGLQSELSIKRLYQSSAYYHEAIAFYQSKGFELSAFVPNNEGNFPYLVETDCIMFRSEAVPKALRKS